MSAGDEIDDPQSAMRSGLVWLSSAAALIRIIDLAALVVVLWFISREELGVASVAISVCSILEAASAHGLGVSAAIVQAPKLTRHQIDTAFWFHVPVGLLVALGMAVAAPFVALAYDAPELAPMLWVLCGRHIAMSTLAVPIQLLNRQLKFREVAGAQTLASLAAALVRAATAFAGFGAWALVGAQLMQSVALLFAVLALSKFRPLWSFSKAALAPLFRFGSRLAAAEGVHQLFLNLDYIIIGRVLGLGALGIYRVAFDVAMQVVMPVAMILTRTAVPVLSRVAQQADKFRATFLWTTRSLGLLISPILIALFLGAEDLLQLLGEGEFTGALGTARLLVIAAYLRVHFQLFNPLFTAWGVSHIVLRLELLALALLTTTLLLSLHLLAPTLGVASAAIAWLAMYPLLFVTALLVARREVKLPLLKFAAQMIPGAVTLALVGGASYAFAGLTASLPPLPHLLLVVVVVVSLSLLLARVAFGVDVRRLFARPPEPAKPAVEDE